MVDILECGFEMVVAKSDATRQGVQYDVNEGFKKLNSSFALSGIASTVTLSEMISSLGTQLPIREVEVFEKFDADLNEDEKTKNCVSFTTTMTYILLLLFFKHGYCHRN